mmetsp:Transcript_35771/g.102855  ORF Transcript_35771/g.102855 Transcript_35771/m.102855 type:complete len:348 (-) Transcript_35771:155-1198(-)
MPEGQGLASLRSLGRVRMADDIGFYSRWDVAEVDEFRQLLVRRGCVRSLQEMELDVGEYLEDTAEMRQLIENAVKLIDAAMHPDARSQPIMPCIRSGNREDGQIDLQLLAWSHRHRSPMVQKLVNDFAKGVRNVVFNERPRPSHANPVTPATFPHATTLILPIRFPRHKQVDRAVEVAVNMPRLERVECGGSCSAFLKALHAAAPEKKLRSVALNLTAERLVISNWDREWDEAETRTSLPEIELMELGLEGELVGDSQLDELHGKVLTLLLAFSKLKGVKRSRLAFRSPVLCTSSSTGSPPSTSCPASPAPSIGWSGSRWANGPATPACNSSSGGCNERLMGLLCRD